MSDRESSQGLLEWAGPALFTAVLIGVVAFFWWFLF